MRTDREIIIKTVEYLKSTAEILAGKDSHVDILALWNRMDVPVGNRQRLRVILLESELINMGGSWSFELTAKGLISTPSDFDKSGRYLTKDKNAKLKNSAIIVCIIISTHYVIQILDRLALYFP
ncbi:MAG: hypothetical protein COA79_26050 [Planctomycetota bacterium]|nr:MAG: hypothetical protein COA79_26050 [Planctomycetota bacterium]